MRISEVVQETLGLDSCASMIGANVASEIARGLFSEGTIGCRELARGLEIKRLLEVRESVRSPASTSDIFKYPRIILNI